MMLFYLVPQEKMRFPDIHVVDISGYIESMEKEK